MLQIYQQRQLERIWNTLDQAKRREMKDKFEDLSEVEKLVQSSHKVRIKK